MKASVVALEGLHKHYRDRAGAVPVLRGIDLRVEAGEFVALLGPSGSGKSSLLNVIGCLDAFDVGCYRLMGEPVHELSADQLAWRRGQHIGFVFQSFHLLATHTALENVCLPLCYTALARREWAARGREQLARFGIESLASRRPDQLSGGQRQRVAIARALINRPALILADEPTGSLDRDSGRQVVEVLESLAAAGLTVVVVTHDEAVAARAGRRLRLHDGRIAA